jgi:hypothetical protein
MPSQGFCRACNVIIACASARSALPHMLHDMHRIIPGQLVLILTREGVLLTI